MAQTRMTPSSMTLPGNLLPEWHSQEAILLSWPDAHTDWATWLDAAQTNYIELINAINAQSCPVILLVREDQISVVQTMLPETARVLLVLTDYNDTWIRDYGFLTCRFLTNKNKHEMQPISFQFNGWGNKFKAEKDNKINKSVLSDLCRHSITEYDLVVEGGALEINGEGVLLSTEFCLSNPERNGELSLDEYKKHFTETLGAKHTIILKNGHLEGDDTDGHIDTLVRFTPDNNLVIQSAFNRLNDSHFEGLNTLVEECRQHFPDSKIFQLPLPDIQNQDGDRLPASYANFLISNGNIFAPVYGQPEDKIALEVLAEAYPQFKILPVNCHTLIQQYGSLHCISMQVPTNTLKPEIIEQAQSGVSVYGG